MGTTKKDLFTIEQNEIADLAKALGHPARIAILQILINSKECINSDLVNELGLAQATISQHLKELKNVGLIQGSVEGVSVCYCINAENWQKVKALMNEFFDSEAGCDDSSCC